MKAFVWIFWIVVLLLLEFGIEVVKNEDNYGYREAWRDVLVDEYEGYHPIMTDFHFHDFYEISLIFSGDMGIYLPSVERVGIFTGLVLSPRGTPHYITCTEKALYKRTNVVKSERFSDIIHEVMNRYCHFMKK